MHPKFAVKGQRCARPLLLLGLGASLAGCRVEVDYEGSSFACSDSVCPSGFECVDGECRPPAGADDTPADDGTRRDGGMPSSGAPDAAMTGNVVGDGAAVPCEGGDDSVSDPSTGHCYLFFLNQDQRTWSGAQEGCAALEPPAHLLTVGSEEETALVAPHLDLFDWWMGATDLEVEMTWQWLTGEPLAYVNWRTGEPNNYGTGEDCGILEGDTGALWDDRDCASVYRWVCERD